MIEEAAPGVREGDMVADVRTDEVLGILHALRVDDRGAGRCTVMVANNVLRSGWSWRNLRQATPEEVERDGYGGVGCNDYRGKHKRLQPRAKRVRLRDTAATEKGDGPEA